MKKALTLAVENPYSKAIVANVQYVQDPIRLIDLSRQAQKQWSQQPLKERISVLTKVIEWFRDRKMEIGKSITDQMGKPLTQSLTEVDRFTKNMQQLTGMTQELETVVIEDSKDFYRAIQKYPLGIILHIASFNYPLNSAGTQLFTPLIAGNSVLLKHSPYTPLIGDMMQQAFEESGAPKGLVQHFFINTLDLNHYYQKVDGVSIIGSVSAGLEVNKEVSNLTMNQVTMELGGKDAAYVMKDANISHAVQNIAQAAFYNAGQSCCAIQRAYIHKDIYKKFIEELIIYTSDQFIPGDPQSFDNTLGPLTIPEWPHVLEERIAQACEDGAEVLVGGYPCTDNNDKGRFFMPTIIQDVNEETELYQQDSFGPIIQVYPVEDSDQAVKLINSQRFGLSTSIFTNSKDMDQLMKISKELRTGTVYLNKCDTLDSRLPWSGRGLSGKGFFQSHLSYRNVVKFKSINFKLK